MDIAKYTLPLGLIGILCLTSRAQLMSGITSAVTARAKNNFNCTSFLADWLFINMRHEEKCTMMRSAPLDGTYGVKLGQSSIYSLMEIRFF